MPWKDICDALTGGNLGCSSNISGQLTVGVDVNDDGSLDDTEDDYASINIIVTKPEDSVGIDTVGVCKDTETGDRVDGNGACYFTAFPGDQKVYINDLDFGSQFDKSGAVIFNRLRVYFSDESFALALSNSPLDFAIASPLIGGTESDSGDNSGFYLKSQYIDDLTNGTIYYFRLAVVDEANNVAYFTSEDYLNELLVDGKKVCNPSPNPPPNPSPSFDPDKCPYTAIPQKVHGFLSEELNCFIATAAYGSPFAPRVKTLRQFRDRFLLTHSMGREFVRIYYKYSPPLAHWIASRSILRQAVSVLLWPFWLVALSFLYLGPWVPLLFLSLIAFLPIFYFFTTLHRRKRSHRVM